MSKRIPHWKRSDKLLSFNSTPNVLYPERDPAIKYELAEFSVNMNKGFAGLPAEYETCLAGRHGEIWQSSPSQYKVVFTSTAMARKFAAALGLTTTCVKGDEPIFTFHENHLPVAIAHLKIPQSPGTRVKLANSFGR